MHPTALIDSRAKIADDVSIGPYTIIGPDVEIGAGCEIGPHVVINGPTQLGQRNRIFQFASIGEACQDKKYAGEPTRLIMGDDNVVRESVTLHRGTVQDRGETTIGSRNLFMAYAHVGHDCIIGDDCIFANAATLAGHVKIGNFAILGGLSAIHQFCHMGDHAMAGGGSIITKDIAAYVIVNGNPAETHGLNLVGLRRRGFSKEAIKALSQAYKLVFRQGLTLQQAIDALEQMTPAPEELQVFIDSLKSSQRGLTR
ncbi:acyl-[acyl-carrier-protein]--UDP-N-acetylglucosamine O-acyltransferase [Terasakiispira papahanaumokuakeensis]|uniref:Acyl-[acyl-carrier-protein]--UDP-N-acetylglucosamine O-acyltransferase n=1 Tax=Terasakiispira papahanaumokuakeensis TaxID=197479 RepID=A0A1E2VEN8_9GAMM|nr:acyl-[acyl-carrier-protein]--UDP-N-acetylglucosamine O-acyltransferase [Terasakiispira papahanaumokuakeensis]